MWTGERVIHEIRGWNMADQVFCPRCGMKREGPLCTSCGYDYVEGARTPAVTLSRGVNPVSLVFLILGIAFVAWLIYVSVLPTL